MWSPLLSWCNRTSEFKRRKRETSIHFIHGNLRVPRPYSLGERWWHLGRGYPYIPMINDIEISTNFLKNHRSPQQRRCLASHRHRWVFLFFLFFWRWRLRNEHQWFGMMVWHGLEMSGLNLPHFLIKQRGVKQRIKNTNFERQRCKQKQFILLMVQKSGDHQLREGSFITLFTVFQHRPRGLFGISEPSTVAFGQTINAMNKSPKPHTWRGATGVDLCGFFFKGIQMGVGPNKCRKMP